MMRLLFFALVSFSCLFFFHNSSIFIFDVNFTHVCYVEQGLENITLGWNSLIALHKVYLFVC